MEGLIRQDAGIKGGHLKPGEEAPQVVDQHRWMERLTTQTRPGMTQTELFAWTGARNVSQKALESQLDAWIGFK